MERTPPGTPIRHPHRGRTAPSQVGGNRDRTAPPPSTPDGARDRGRTRGGARTTWDGPTSAQCRDRARCAHHTTQGGGSGRRGSASAHTRKGHGGTTRRATGPGSRNAQTAWNGVPASEGRGHPDGTARHTQRGTRGAGRGKWERHNTRYRPEPPAPAASAAHTRTGHCTRQGSSGAQRHAPTPRLGSLRDDKKLALRVPPAWCTQCTRARAFGCAHGPRCKCGASSQNVTLCRVLGLCSAAWHETHGTWLTQCARCTGGTLIMTSQCNSVQHSETRKKTISGRRFLHKGGGGKCAAGQVTETAWRVTPACALACTGARAHCCAGRMVRMVACLEWLLSKGRRAAANSSELIDI